MKTENIETLSLLSYKVAPNIFDISSSLHHISIRDQIVRANILVNDLVEAHFSSSDSREILNILIVGAGVAGVSAAIKAKQISSSTRNINTCIVESNETPFELFKGVTERYIGPYMYEWPSCFFSDQSLSSHPFWGDTNSLFTWKSKDPLSAHELYEELIKETKEKDISIVTKQSREKIRKFISDYALHFYKKKDHKNAGTTCPSLDLTGEETWPKNMVITDQFKPNYIILTLGMGDENITLLKKQKVNSSTRNFTGIPFWSNDDIIVNNSAYSKCRTAVFGGGDGALQDVLRILTGDKHVLETIEKIEKNPTAKKLIDQEINALISIDRQHGLHSNWEKEINYNFIDGKTKKIAARLSNHFSIQNTVRRLIKNGSGKVIHFIRNEHFDKSYLLNRFLVHLINECLKKQKGKKKRTMEYLLVTRSAASGLESRKTRFNKQFKYEVTVKTKGKKQKHRVDKLIVRYGVLSNTIPGKVIAMSKHADNQRTNLAKIGQPFINYIQ